MEHHPGVELQMLDTTVQAQRDILRARRPEDVVAALERAVTRLGGDLVRAHVAGGEALHVDIGLGVRGPLLPCAAPDDPARSHLEHVLPGLVEDGQRMVQRLWRLAERDDPTLHDDLTGALHATATTRLIGRSAPGTALVGFGLDPSGAVERLHGTARLHHLLHQLAMSVRSELDVDERVGRLHGLAVVAVLPRPEGDHARVLRRRLEDRWRRRPDATGIALRAAVTVTGDEPIDALARLRDELGLGRDDAARGTT
ncbi:hypothetical protein [Egicoccus sp. AB-alg6-2]|uniref:hypothetical protein n=1 Tax=Egicoccus sp. AB-alg6-2 TaxID=3242692 RepID=UPI00359DED67